MTNLLIPIEEFSLPALAAVRFAVEFGKRSGARLFFLFIDGGEPGKTLEAGRRREPAQGSEEPSRREVKETIESLIALGRSGNGLQTEIHCRKGDFVQEVRQFVRDYPITEIILSLPDEQDQAYPQRSNDIVLLNQLTHCRILTVKPKTKGV